jgi:hypothetical protein
VPMLGAVARAGPGAHGVLPDGGPGSTPCASRPRTQEHTVCVQTADPGAHRVRPDRGPTSTPCASRPRTQEHTVCVQTAGPRAHRVRPDRGLGSTPCASRLVAVLISTGSIATELGTHRSVVCGLGYARAEMGEHATAMCDLSTAAKPRIRPGCGCRAATATRRAVAHPRGASRSESNRPSGCSTTTCQRTREPDRIRSPIQTLRARAAGPAFAGRSEHAQLDYAHPTTRDQHARPATRDHHTHLATRDLHTRPHPPHK